MNKRDLNQIKDIFNEVFREQFRNLFSESFNKSFAQIWEHNLEPSLTGLSNRLDKVENRLSKIESNYVTKDYLDEKLGDFKADINTKFSGLENKTTRLTTVLHRKKIISKVELEEINSI